jgi:choline dehydrogenase-like flavoprotein
MVSVPSSPLHADLIVIGSGAGGAAVAGEALRAGRSVVLVEAGQRLTDRLGHNRRNDFDLEGFVAFVERTLAFHADGAEALADLPGAKTIHAVGGMLVHWTNNCPEPRSEELPSSVPESDWPALFDRSRTRLYASSALGDRSVLQRRLLDRIRAVVPSARPMAVAARLSEGGLVYSGADVLLDDGSGRTPAHLRVLHDCVARRLRLAGGRITGVEVHARDGGPAQLVEGPAFVVAAGAIGAPQLLLASGVDAGPALGRYLMDHPVVSSRIVLDSELRADVPDDDPPFSVWLPSSPARDWHAQIYRFGLGLPPLPPGIRTCDTAEITALCGTDPDPENRIWFDSEQSDPFGLPAVRARFTLSAADRGRIDEALRDQFAIAGELADVHQGFSPQLWPLGGAFHLLGTYRMGQHSAGESVTDSFSRVWAYDNLYLAGNGLFDRRIACNPTLTTVAIALRSSDEILRRF